MKLYEITNITDRDGITRSDSRHSERIGSKVTFFFPLSENATMLLEYKSDAYNKPKDGMLRTSIVEKIKIDGKNIIVTTRNSIYYFKEI